MSKIDFIQIIFFLAVFKKNEKLIFKKMLVRCINGNKNMCWQKVTFLENFGGRTFLDIYLDIFQLCQNDVFSGSFSIDFSTHKCRDRNPQNIFDTAR